MRAPILVVAIAVLAPLRAQAYPQFQLAMGPARCSSCHYSPTGGGLISGYGREKAGDTISAWGGDGGFLHGAVKLPEWLALGADLRGAQLVSYEGAKAGVDHPTFPMQMDLYGRLDAGAFSLNVIGGIRGSTDRKQPAFASRLFSREHYLLWRPSSEGIYVRLGRFFAPYGLGLAEHITYVRRFLGFNTLEETYNLTVGWFGDRWELHATAFTPDFWRDEVGERGNGGALSYQRRFGDSLILGAQGRVVAGDEDTRVMGGLMAKKLFNGPRVQLMAEVDVVHQSIKDADYDTWQFAGYAGGAWYPAKGWIIQLIVERWDEDMRLKGVARDAVDAEIQWFPYAHFEVNLFARYQLLGSGSDDGSGSELALLQLHYYL